MWSNHAGVQPIGNLLYEQGGFAAGISSRSRTLGSFAVLSDSLICRILPFLAPNDLAKFSQLSSACRAFSMDEDLWRTAVFREFGISFHFSESWRKTYIRTRLAQSPASISAVDQHNAAITWHTNCITFYSDVLFLKWRCLYASIQPKWTELDNVARISPATISTDLFREKFEEAGVPVIIRDVVTHWPAFSKWDIEYLNDEYAETKFHAGGFEFPLEHYFNYCAGVLGLDDQTLTIFDKKFAEKAPEMAQDYYVPAYFEEDLFSVFGDKRRPDYRWLIIGPERSGSSFHKDPNCTSAWNGVITGKKKWILFPPKFPPPGIVPTEDGSNVAGPISVIEWFVTYYAAAHEYGKTVGAIECVVNSGEMMFIPAGWWHIVLNLDFTIAITQNYVSSANVVSVAKWLQDKPNQVSGCGSEKQKQYVASNFARLVAEKRPDLRRRLRAHGLLKPADGSVFVPDTDDDESESSFEYEPPGRKATEREGLEESANEGAQKNSSGGSEVHIENASEGNVLAVAIPKESNESIVDSNITVPSAVDRGTNLHKRTGVSNGNKTAKTNSGGEENGLKAEESRAVECEDENASTILASAEVPKAGNGSKKEHMNGHGCTVSPEPNIFRVDGAPIGENGVRKESPGLADSTGEPIPKKPRVGLWESLKQKPSTAEAAESEKEAEGKSFSFNFQV